MACIYILYSPIKDRFYVGSSREEQPLLRLAAHNAGKTRSTKAGRPWQLVHQEVFVSYTDARCREIYLKTGQGREWIRERFKQ